MPIAHPAKRASRIRQVSDAARRSVKETASVNRVTCVGWRIARRMKLASAVASWWDRKRRASGVSTCRRMPAKAVKRGCSATSCSVVVLVAWASFRVVQKGSPALAETTVPHACPPAKRVSARTVNGAFPIRAPSPFAPSSPGRIVWRNLAPLARNAGIGSAATLRRFRWSALCAAVQEAIARKASSVVSASASGAARGPTRTPADLVGRASSWIDTGLSTGVRSRRIDRATGPAISRHPNQRSPSRSLNHPRESLKQIPRVMRSG